MSEIKPYRNKQSSGAVVLKKRVHSDRCKHMEGVSEKFVKVPQTLVSRVRLVLLRHYKERWVIPTRCVVLRSFINTGFISACSTSLPPHSICIRIYCTRLQSVSWLLQILIDHFVSHVLICLFLIHLFSTIISLRQCHHHHYYHPSPHHSSIPNSKLSHFSNPALRRHLAPPRTDFTDTRTSLRFFSVLQFFF